MNNSFLLEKIDENNLLGNSGELFFQSKYWAAFKSNFGWQPYCFLLDKRNFIVFIKKIWSGFSLAYIPFAPDIKYCSKLFEISCSLKAYLPKDVFVIRYDLPWEQIPFPKNLPDNCGSDAAFLHDDSGQLYKKAVNNFDMEAGDVFARIEYPVLQKYFFKTSDVQPSSTVILDLSGKDSNAILAGMKHKTRYNIRLAAKKGVSVKQYGVDYLSKWYDLYKETSKRDKIALHSFDYYKKIFELSAIKEFNADVRLYMAEYNTIFLAGIVTCFYNNRATYLYGASSNLYRETMPAYALQWKAICDAVDAGCMEYDFFGIPPTDDPAHPMHGLYQFKTGFGGKIVHRYGCWDFPAGKLRYNFYKLAERARNYYFKRLKKR